MADLLKSDSSFRGTIDRKIVSNPLNYDFSDVDYRSYIFDLDENLWSVLDNSEYYQVFGNKIFMNTEDSIGERLLKLKYNSTDSRFCNTVVGWGGINKYNDSTFVLKPFIYLMQYDEGILELKPIKSNLLTYFINSGIDYSGAGELGEYPKNELLSSSTIVPLDETSAIHFDYGGLTILTPTPGEIGSIGGGDPIQEFPEQPDFVDITHLNSGTQGYHTFEGKGISLDGTKILFVGGGTYESLSYLEMFETIIFDPVTREYSGYSDTGGWCPGSHFVLINQDSTVISLEGSQSGGTHTYVMGWNDTSHEQYEISSTAGKGIHDACAVVYGNYMYLFGGRVNQSSTSPYDGIQEFDLEAMEYGDEEKNYLVNPVCHASAAIDGTKVYITGGCNGSWLGNYNDQKDYLQIYDIIDNTCYLGVSIPDTHAFHNSFITDGTLYLYGGNCNKMQCIALTDVMDGDQVYVSVPDWQDWDINEESYGTWCGCACETSDQTPWFYGGCPRPFIGTERAGFNTWNPNLPMDYSTAPEDSTHITLGFSPSKYNKFSKMTRYNPIGSGFIEISTDDTFIPSDRFGHSLSRLGTNKLILVGGGFDTTLLNISSLYIVAEDDYTSVVQYDLSGQYERINDVTISTGSFGMESILTDLTTGQDFNDITTAGLNGYYVSFPNDVSNEVHGICIEVAGGSVARFVLHYYGDSTSIFDEVMIPPFYYLFDPGDDRRVCIYIDLPDNTKVVKIQENRYNQQ